MLKKILDQIKQLSEDQIIEFNEKFKEFYKPIEQRVKKQNLAKKRKEAKEKEKITIKAGDRICELLGINGFPISSMQRLSYYPYTPEVVEDTLWEKVMEVFDDNGIKIDNDIWCVVEEFKKKFHENSPKSWYYKESDLQFLGDYDNFYTFYIKGGDFNWNIVEEEFESYLLGDDQDNKSN